MGIKNIMEKIELIDKLNRAYQMEGEMDSELVNLCQPESLPKEMPEKSRERIRSILLSIRSDILRHKEMVLKIRNDNVKIDKIILGERLRQMLAVDTNAYALYVDLSLRIDDELIQEELLKISKDAKRHCILELEALSILEE